MKKPKCKTPYCTSKAYWNAINHWYYCKDCLRENAREVLLKHSAYFR